MRTQRLWGGRFDTPRDVVRWLGALQARNSRWPNGRSRSAPAAPRWPTSQEALATGVIVRTHVLRPTWHFALGEDIRWLLKVTAPRVHALNAYYNRQHELDDKLFRKANAAIATALRDGPHLTRRELAVVLKRAGIRAEGTRLPTSSCVPSSMPSCAVGRCEGSSTRMRCWMNESKGKPLDREAALAELTRRYFTSAGQRR